MKLSALLQKQHMQKVIFKDSQGIPNLGDKKGNNPPEVLSFLGSESFTKRFFCCRFLRSRPYSETPEFPFPGLYEAYT